MMNNQLQLAQPPILLSSGEFNQGNAWIDPGRLRLGASARLFCFPHAGGSEVKFINWQEEFPLTMDVIPIQLPGRGRRMREAPFTNLLEVASVIAQNLLDSLDRPFALFGHSMGALIAFEVARTLRARHGVSPAALMVAGCPAPERGDRKMTHYLTDDEFKNELRRLNGTPEELLSDTEAMMILLPTLRADFQMVETYPYVSAPPLRCPILAFGGLQDIVTVDELEAWREQTVDQFSLQMFEGDHFFPETVRSELLATIATHLSRLC